METTKYKKLRNSILSIATELIKERIELIEERIEDAEDEEENERLTETLVGLHQSLKEIEEFGNYQPN